MKINAHVHISIYNNNAPDLAGAFQALLDDMAKHEINFAIVIPDNIENLSTIADLNKAKELISENDKFFLLGSPQITQRGSSEVDAYEKLILGKTIRGIKLFPGHDPYYPTDKRCEPYYRLCEKSDVPVVFHTGENSGDSECARWNDPKYIVEVAKKYPALKIVIAHYFWPKMDFCYEITKNLPNIYFDLSAVADEEVVEATGGLEIIKNILTKTIADRPDKIIFGTDWPMCKTKNHIDLIDSLNLELKINNNIFFNNAVNLYKLPLDLL